ncbi:hypothetical protein BJ508DRAFT_332722 [Ascobolus immersus RN42]|uniref:Uncharacterized protein n=1 Tax=Ascobolus immersus RN42 TaxID=1160509 RepID=A0A3N4HSL0_ASCIM|nr:hypothetical protein BJ508DRAFT_332722 [Ascobolus immersus RN42]
MLPHLTTKKVAPIVPTGAGTGSETKLKRSNSVFAVEVPMKPIDKSAYAMGSDFEDAAGGELTADMVANLGPSEEAKFVTAGEVKTDHSSDDNGDPIVQGPEDTKGLEKDLQGPFNLAYWLGRAMGGDPTFRRNRVDLIPAVNRFSAEYMQLFPNGPPKNNIRRRKRDSTLIMAALKHQDDAELELDFVHASDDDTETESYMAPNIIYRMGVNPRPRPSIGVATPLEGSEEELKAKYGASIGARYVKEVQNLRTGLMMGVPHKTSYGIEWPLGKCCSFMDGETILLYRFVIEGHETSVPLRVKDRLIVKAGMADLDDDEEVAAYDCKTWEKTSIAGVKHRMILARLFAEDQGKHTVFLTVLSEETFNGLGMTRYSRACAYLDIRCYKTHLLPPGYDQFPFQDASRTAAENGAVEENRDDAAIVDQEYDELSSDTDLSSVPSNITDLDYQPAIDALVEDSDSELDDFDDGLFGDDEMDFEDEDVEVVQDPVFIDLTGN